MRWTKTLKLSLCLRLNLTRKLVFELFEMYLFQMVIFIRWFVYEGCHNRVQNEICKPILRPIFLVEIEIVPSLDKYVGHPQLSPHNTIVHPDSNCKVFDTFKTIMTIKNKTQEIHIIGIFVVPLRNNLCYPVGCCTFYRSQCTSHPRWAFSF